MLPQLAVADISAVTLFVTVWVAYTRFARVKARSQRTLSSVMRHHRVQWMVRMMANENRITDASLLANLERVVAFFASTTLLIIAGILTAVSTVEGTLTILINLPFSVQVTPAVLQLKLLLLAMIFVYAFFKFTWSIRQYNFFAVLLGAAPGARDADVTAEALTQFSERSAKLIDLASHEFNHGLRAYYFAMALFTWLVSPWVCMLSTLWVVWVLYRREFHSQALKTLDECREYRESPAPAENGKL